MSQYSNPSVGGNSKDQNPKLASFAAWLVRALDT